MFLFRGNLSKVVHNHFSYPPLLFKMLILFGTKLLENVCILFWAVHKIYDYFDNIYSRYDYPTPNDIWCSTKNLIANLSITVKNIHFLKSFGIPLAYIMPIYEMPLNLVFRVHAFSASFSVVLGFRETMFYHQRFVWWLSTYYEVHCITVPVMVFRGKFVWVDLKRDPFLLYFPITS